MWIFLHKANHKICSEYFAKTLQSLPVTWLQVSYATNSQGFRPNCSGLTIEYFVFEGIVISFIYKSLEAKIEEPVKLPQNKTYP